MHRIADRHTHAQVTAQLPITHSSGCALSRQARPDAPPELTQSPQTKETQALKKPRWKTSHSRQFCAPSPRQIVQPKLEVQHLARGPLPILQMEHRPHRVSDRSKPAKCPRTCCRPCPSPVARKPCSSRLFHGSSTPSLDTHGLSRIIKSVD